jgi:hypothetical protein
MLVCGPSLPTPASASHLLKPKKIRRLKETSTQPKQNQKIKRNAKNILTRLYGREGEEVAWVITG